MPATAEIPISPMGERPFFSTFPEPIWITAGNAVIRTAVMLTDSSVMLPKHCRKIKKTHPDCRGHRPRRPHSGLQKKTKKAIVNVRTLFVGITVCNCCPIAFISTLNG